MKISKPITTANTRKAAQARASHARGVDATQMAQQTTDVTRDTFGGVAERVRATQTAEHSAEVRAQQQQLTQLTERVSAQFPHTQGSGAQGSGLVRGVGAGVLAKDAAQANAALENGQAFVFVLKAPVSPADLALACQAQALVVVGRKQNTSHLAQALGRPAVRLSLDAVQELPGFVTVDGTRGVVGGKLAIKPGVKSADAQRGIADLRARYGLNVTAVASTPEKIAEAIVLGADRIRVDGNALMSGARPLLHLRRYLLETEAAPRMAALKNLVALACTPAQQLIAAAGSLPVTFSLGEQSPHAFFPTDPAQLEALALELRLPLALVKERVGELGAGNSKLGLRGARWGVKDPELFAAWSRSIFEAWARVSDEGHAPGALRLHIPNVGLGGDVDLVKRSLEQQRKLVQTEFGVEIPVSYSAGIDTAGGALAASEISEHVAALEYASGDMTETLFGMSQDDAQQYLDPMLEQGLLPANPFKDIDLGTVGKMIAVGQYLAGDTPNAFAAALSGPHGLSANGVLAARQAGIRDVVVPASAAFAARSIDARVQSALSDTVGYHRPTASDDLRNSSSKLFALLVDKNQPAVKAAPQKIPEGASALEHVEALKAQVDRGTLSTAAALMSVPANIVDQLSKPVVDPTANIVVLSKGIAASPGCGQGRIALSKEKAAEYAAAKEPYVLVVTELHTDQVEACRAAAGLISVRGGKTSHAAMIASDSEVPCVMDEKVLISVETGSIGLGPGGRHKLKEGDWLTLDATKGQVLSGQLPLLNPQKSVAFSALMQWADEHRTLDVFVNTDKPENAKVAFERGAQGVGLVRSEHMFYEADRMLAFRAVLLSEIGERKAEIAVLEKVQTDDYTALLSAAGERKVSVRLLDPPLDEFIPKSKEQVDTLAAAMGISSADVLERVNRIMVEVDSMLGMRGVRLAMKRPDIEAMQVRSLAMAHVAASKSGPCAPIHIIVPQVSTAEEMRAARGRILATVAQVEAETGAKVPVQLGSMIETPRAAMVARDIAKYVDFFSYGTNDLTQGTLGYGRNVAAKFIPALIKSGALATDPTESLDEQAVVKLIKVAECLGKDQNAALYGGVCGDQAGDPKSIASILSAGCKYISVPLGKISQARLASAQAAIAQAQNIELPDAPQLETFKEVNDLARACSALSRVPTDISQQHLVDHAEACLRQLHNRIRIAQQAAPEGHSAATLMAMEASVQARELLDNNKIAQAIQADTTIALATTKDVPPQQAAAASVNLAELGARIASANGAKGTAAARALASNVWAGVRTLEELRGVRERSQLLGSAHGQKARLWHHNDGWDNQSYTDGGLKAGESMIDFMKRAAGDFLADNDVTVEAVGFDLSTLPTDRPVILAVAHRSGAIDRFVTMGSLPIASDELAYVVREGSPYDLIAKAHFKEHPADNPILAPTTSEALMAAAGAAFQAGRRFLLTYPEGTGSVVGETRTPATSVARLAIEHDALIVPITPSDSALTRPMDGGRVLMHIGKPIDPRTAAAVSTFAPERVVHTELSYVLSRPYRAKL